MPDSDGEAMTVGCERGGLPLRLKRMASGALAPLDGKRVAKEQTVRLTFDPRPLPAKHRPSAGQNRRQSAVKSQTKEQDQSIDLVSLGC